MTLLQQRCDDCGRFCQTDGATWAEIYDFVAMGLDHEHLRCSHCTDRLGPAQSNATPHGGDLTPYQGELMTAAIVAEAAIAKAEGRS